ncbi:hypothetical protein KSC_003690 [Ktedonobacter sp. SOSP1-52]|nr:hypothetical protein KSC_003690 [Ktedonobacter sp. SOSP1-52]
MTRIELIKQRIDLTNRATVAQRTLLAQVLCPLTTPRRGEIEGEGKEREPLPIE